MAAIEPPQNPYSQALLAAIAPDYQTQAMQAQRRLTMAQQLQEMSLQDTPGNGGSVSWTQGLARALEGLVGGSMQRKAFGQMQLANQGLGQSMRQGFGVGTPQAPPQAPQMPQGAPPQATPAPQMPQSAPQQAPADPLAPLPDQAAPPQAAPQPPLAPQQSAPMGGAASGNPLFPTEPGLTPMQSMMHYGTDEAGYWKNVAAANAPTDFAKSLQQAGIDPASATGRRLMQAMVAHQLYQAPVSFRPGGWSQDASGQLTFHPQAPAPGAMPVMDASGKPTGAWTEDPSASNIQAHQAGAVAGAQGAARAPYQLTQVYNNETGQMETVPVSAIPGVGGGAPGKYTPGAGGGAPGSSAGPAVAGGNAPAGPPLGLPQAQGELGKGYAQQFNNEQDLAKQVPAQRQSLYNMWNIVKSGTPVGPSAHKLQELAKDWGITPLANSNLFVFDKNSSRFIAQSMAALGVQGSDARMGLIGSATPNSQMDAAALNKVIPEVIGLQNAVAAKADAKAHWIQTHPNGVMSSPQFESWWRQNYDPRIFTMMAFGPETFKAAINKLPPAARQTYMNKYYALRDMGVDYSQFAQ